MSDDLRDRIAATLVDHASLELVDLRNMSVQRCKCGQLVQINYPGDPTRVAMEWSDHVADAVIRELNLEREESGICGEWRYATDWKADDDTPNP